MSTGEHARIELEEFRPLRMPRDLLPLDVGEQIWRDYARQVAVEFPSPKTGQEWELTAQGWVGHIPLSPGKVIVLHPKVALNNLFRMLEYAYSVQFETSGELVHSASIEDFYERLAHILALRVLDRGRKGFYRDYVHESDQLPYLRGRLDVPQLARSPWSISPLCHFQEHTPDIEENQILAWTLFCVARSGMCGGSVLSAVRQAYRSLQHTVSLAPVSPAACMDRLYNRLNNDYRPLHALCWFFLEHAGPTHEAGDRKMLPFLIDMNRLFEKFVAEWLRAHLPKPYTLKVQERACIGDGGRFYFDIDLVLYDVAAQRPTCVLDTKYKAPDSPSSEDIAQVVAYSQLKDCRQAFLLYPTQLSTPIDEYVGDIRVRSLTFDISADLAKAGTACLESVLAQPEEMAASGVPVS